MEFFIFSCLSVISFFLFSYLFIQKIRKPWCNCDVCKCYLSSSWALEFDNLCDWYTYLLRSSPTGTIHVHVLGNMITSNPENVKHMLMTRFDNYPKGKPFSVLLSDLLGNGIFNVDGESWRFQRKMASLELGSVSIRNYAFDTVSSEIKLKLIPLMESYVGRVLDLQDVFRRFSFDYICRFSFGVDPGCLKLSLPVSEFARAFDLASRLSAERAMVVSPMVWKMKRVLNIGSEKKLKEAIRVVKVLAKEVIQHKRNLGFSTHKDLLSRFMANVDDEEYLTDIVVSFLLAGRDTIASALGGLTWLLARNPKAVALIREESDRIISTNNSKLANFDQLNHMHYLNAVVYESMRLFPPVQFDSKFAREDDILPDGTFIRSGTRVTYHPYAMGRMERVWGPDCLEFKPERWLLAGVFTPACLFKYPVFQAGPRVCLGKELALVEMKSVALALLRRFDMEVSGNGSSSMRFAPGLTATIRGGLPVIVQDRRRR